MKSTVSKKLVKFDQTTDNKLVALPNEPKPQAVTVKTVKDPQFPVDAFPVPFQNLIKELSEKQGLNSDWCGTAAIGYLGSAVGAKVRLRVTGKWIAPCCFYTCIIGESGMRKSPVLDFFGQPIEDIESLYQDDYETAFKKWTAEKKQCAVAKIEFNDDAPERKDFMIKSATIESMDKVLTANRHGVLVTQDELVGLLKSFNRYSQGNDQERFLEYFEGKSIKTNRMGSKTQYVRFSNVCIVGGTQPSKMGEFAGKGRSDDGTVYRFLFSYPDGIKKPYLKENVYHIEHEEYYHELFRRLHALQFDRDERGRDVPHILNWCKEAQAMFKKWHDVNADVFNASQVTQEKSIMAKTEGILPRLALLVELMHQLTDNETVDLKKVCVSADSFTKAKKLVDYFYHMALKVQGSIHNLEETVTKYPSGIKWNILFSDSELCLKSKDIKDWIMKEYGFSSRKCDDCLKELTFVSYGVYKI